MADFTRYFKQSDSPTVYGTTQAGVNVAFENEQQFLDSGGNWGRVQTVNSGPINAVNYSQYSVSPRLAPAVISSDYARSETQNNMNTLNNYQQNLAQIGANAANARGVAPIPNQASGNKSASPTFYKPDANNQTLFNAQGQPVSAEQYAAQGGKPDFSNVIQGPPPGQMLQTTGVADPALLATINSVNEKIKSGAYGPVPEIDKINDLVAKETLAASGANLAAENKDFSGLDRLMKEMAGIKEQRQELLSQVMKTFEQTDEEKAQDLELQNLKASAQQGILNIENKLIPMHFIAGETAALTKQAELKINNAIANLERLQKQRLDKSKALQFLFSTTENDIKNTIQMYQMLAPENIKTEIGKNGQVSVITRNPITGKYKMDNLGNTKVTTPFYKFDNDTTVYTKEGAPITSPEEYRKLGGRGDWTDVTVIPVGDGELTFSIQDVGGRTVRFGFDNKGKVVSQVDLGASKSGPGGEDNDFLSVSEAAALGVPYGTTKGQARDMGIVPEDEGLQSEEKGKFISETRGVFNQAKGKDGKINPNLYRETMYEYEKKFGDIQSFKKSFPVENWVSDQNQKDDLLDRES